MTASRRCASRSTSSSTIFSKTKGDRSDLGGRPMTAHASSALRIVETAAVHHRCITRTALALQI
jgi:hypothetical protein